MQRAFRCSCCNVNPERSLKADVSRTKILTAVYLYLLCFASFCLSAFVSPARLLCFFITFISLCLTTFLSVFLFIYFFVYFFVPCFLCLFFAHLFFFLLLFVTYILGFFLLLFIYFFLWFLSKLSVAEEMQR